MPPIILPIIPCIWCQVATICCGIEGINSWLKTIAKVIKPCIYTNMFNMIFTIIRIVFLRCTKDHTNYQIIRPTYVTYQAACNHVIIEH